MVKFPTKEVDTILLTTKIKLFPNDEQKNHLLAIMKRFNEACNYISQIAYENNTFSKIKIQKLCYYHVREQYELSAQMVVRAIGKVVESYKTDKKTCHLFKDTSAMIYDDRILSFKGIENASILTLAGRIVVPMYISSYHKGVLEQQRVKGQTDLIYQEETFYLLHIIELPDETKITTNNVLGINLDVTND